MPYCCRITYMASKIEVIKKLTSLFGFSQNHTDILLTLAKHDATAQEILTQTSVSNGRIYRLLGELEQLGLIDKKPGKQAVYSLGDLHLHITKFLNHSHQQFNLKQQQLLDSLQELTNPLQIQILSGNHEDFDNQIINFLDTAKSVQILHKHVSLPWFFYLHHEQTFFDIRSEIKKSRSIGSSANKTNLLLKRAAYLRAYQSKPVTHLMQRATALDFFKKHPTFKKDIIAKLKAYPKTKILLLPELHNPFSTYISNQEVLQVMFFPSRTDRILKLTGQEIIEVYQDYFARYSDSATLLC